MDCLLPQRILLQMKMYHWNTWISQTLLLVGKLVHGLVAQNLPELFLIGTVNLLFTNFSLLDFGRRGWGGIWRGPTYRLKGICWCPSISCSSLSES